MTKRVSKSERKSMAAQLGSLGGKAIVRKRGKAYMKALGKKGGRPPLTSKESSE